MCRKWKHPPLCFGMFLWRRLTLTAWSLEQFHLMGALLSEKQSVPDLLALVPPIAFPPKPDPPINEGFRIPSLPGRAGNTHPPLKVDRMRHGPQERHTYLYLSPARPFEELLQGAPRISPAPLVTCRSQVCLFRSLLSLCLVYLLFLRDCVCCGLGAGV